MKKKEPATKKVRFSPFISIDTNSKVIFITGTNSFTVSKSDAKWFRLFTICGMSATRNISQFKKIQLNGSPSTAEFLDWAGSQGFVSSDPVVAYRPSLASVEAAFDAALLTWKYGITSDELQLATANRPGALTYLIETAWFVMQASNYLGVAVRSNSNRTIKNVFKKLYVEEKDHFKLLIKDLNISEKQLSKHDPSPNARSLVSYLRELATGCPLQFSTSFALLEADRLNSISFKKHLAVVQSKTKLPLAGYKKHFYADFESGHDTLWKSILAEVYPRLKVEELDTAINSIHVTRHQLMAWRGGIAFRAKEASEINNAYRVLQPSDLLREPFLLRGFLAPKAGPQKA